MTMTDPIDVLVVDDHPLFRQGVVHSRELDPSFKVVGEASSGEDALKLALALLPDVVLLDISMPGWGGSSRRRNSPAPVRPPPS
jgi:two-component system nitrate/nitrite response regulator NarL